MTLIIRRLSLFLIIAIGLTSTLSLSACGQKGQLFLPGDPSQIRAEPADGVQEEDEDEDEDDENDNRPR